MATESYSIIQDTEDWIVKFQQLLSEMYIYIYISSLSSSLEKDGRAREVGVTSTRIAPWNY